LVLKYPRSMQGCSRVVQGLMSISTAICQPVQGLQGFFNLMHMRGEKGEGIKHYSLESNKVPLSLQSLHDQERRGEMPQQPLHNPCTTLARTLAQPAWRCVMPRVRPMTSTVDGPAYAPCPTCGGMVLTGTTLTGKLVALDTQGQSYVPLWLEQTPRPVLHESRGYQVHRCPGSPGTTQ
jgi:hypothetical protein